VLAQCLQGFDGLFVIRNEVEEYYVKLNDDWSEAKSNSLKVKNASDQLEAARRAAAMRMYANLGYLMGHFADNPAVVKRFFEVGKLRVRRRKKISLKTAKQKAA
jgi:hypothetical protein